MSFRKLFWSEAANRARDEAKALLQARDENRLFVSRDAYAMRPRQFEATAGGARVAAILDTASASAESWLATISEYLPELRKVPKTADSHEGTPCWLNGSFPGLDGMLLYSLIRKLNPRTYLEIGSGNSTKFARLAIRDGGLRTRIVSVDPQPRAPVDALCDETIRQPLESIEDGFFARVLQAGDVLFIDCSHRSFPNSDVTVFFTEVLPTLPAGVVHGIHDIWLPYDYPPEWMDRFYNEQYLLVSYLLGGHAGDEMIFPGTRISIDPRYKPRIDALFEGEAFDGVERHAGAFWMRRAAQPA